MALRFVKLTRDEMRKLKAGARITEHGISVVRLENGDLRYSVNIMVDGERIHRVIGRESENVTRTQCEAFISQARADARMGRLNLPAGRKVALTFSAASEHYLRLLEETGGKGLADKESHFRLYFVPELGNLPLDRISTFTLEKLRNNLKKRGLAVGTINRAFATYRHMANKLREWGEIKEPLPMIKLQRVDNRRNFVLTPEERTALLNAALQDSNTRVWLFILVGLDTSLRHTEILNARFDSFDRNRRRLTVKVKGGDVREQPLTRALTEILQQEREMADDSDGWIFPNPNSKSGHYESMKAPFRRCVIRTKLNPELVTPHTMRHTAITEITETGASPRTIQAFSGHKSSQMVWRYTHAREQRVNEALDQLEKERTKVVQISEKEIKRS